MPASDDRRASRGRAAALAIVIFASYAYFYEGGGWNQNTRFDLVRAIVEGGTLRIDRYHENTGDKAHLGDHYYTDKAPAASLTAVPAVALARPVMAAFGADLSSDRTAERLAYVATLASAALPAMLAALCVFLIAVRLGATEHAAAFAAIVCGLGTPQWAYATLLYGHALAAGCLMAAFLGALRLGERPPASRELAIATLTGFAAGWAVVTEYPASIASTIILVFALARCGLADRRRLVRIALSIGAGLALGAVVLLAYNWLAFGAPLHIGYTSEEGYAGMRTGILGVSWPKWAAARELLFGSYRGLLPLAPVLAIAPVGFWLLARRQATRAAALTPPAVAVYYFLLTAGYAYWEGGWSYGSRHLGPALPFVCLGIAPVWARARRPVRALILVLACVSVGQSLIAVSTTPQPPAQFKQPMRELLWPAFRDGDFPIGWQSILELGPPAEPMSQLEREGVPRASWNAGEVIGLRGLGSLLPLLSVWLIGAGVWGAAGTTDNRRRTP